MNRARKVFACLVNSIVFVGAVGACGDDDHANATNNGTTNTTQPVESAPDAGGS